jgi:hypothetical protein
MRVREASLEFEISISLEISSSYSSANTPIKFDSLIQIYRVPFAEQQRVHGKTMSFVAQE